LGRIYGFRGVYLHAGYLDPQRPITWRLDRNKGGGGALVDLGSHVIDLLRFLVGDFTEVTAQTETFIRERPLAKDPSKMAPVEVDDVVVMTVRTAGGAVGTVEASRFATGANDELRFEIHGEKGALRFNLEDPNFLEFYDQTAPGGAHGGSRGFTRIETVQRYEPPSAFPGPKFAIGWLRGHMHCLWSFLDAIARGVPPSPGYADGLAVERIISAAYQSASTRRPVEVHRA
jgi:predicted dehydrogenase